MNEWMNESLFNNEWMKKSASGHNGDDRRWTGGVAVYEQTSRSLASREGNRSLWRMTEG